MGLDRDKQEEIEDKGHDEGDDGFLTDNDFDEKEEEYVLEMLPQRWASATQSTTSDPRHFTTFDVIAQTWIDSIGSHKKYPGTTISVTCHDEDQFDPYSEREIAIARALEWIQKHKRKVNDETKTDQQYFDVNSQAGSLRIANLLLSSLASAHQRIPFDSLLCGVEDAAESILNVLRSYANTMAPDANSYAYYLKCLEGESPQDVAHRGQRLLEDMKNGKEVDGVALPAPNTVVYHSLSTLFAQAGLRLPADVKAKVNFSTREAFLTELAAIANNSSSFDRIEALKLIEQMKALGLSLDQEVFNAPLKWAGGAQLSSQFFTRAVSFDSFDKIYQDQDRSSFRDVGVQQAEAIQDWLDTMASYGIKPNLQTYECLIQALIRCGTMDSLKKAESYGRMLLEGTLAISEPLRLETFYPIIAGFAYCGSPEGPVQCDKWIHDVDEKFPQLQARNNFQVAPFVAEVCWQKSQFNSGSSNNFKALERTNQKLQDLFAKCKSSDALPSHDAFILSMQASIDAFTALSQHAEYGKGESDRLKQSMIQLHDIVELYDDLLTSLYTESDDSAAESGGGLDRAKHFAEHAPKIYGAQLLALRQIEKVASAPCCTYLDLSHIERRVRRLEELWIFLQDATENHEKAGNADSSLRQCPNKNWRYPFPYEETLLSFSVPRTREKFLGEALYLIECIADSDHKQYDADLIRLCMLIHNMIRHPSSVSNECGSSFQQRLIQILMKSRVGEKDSLISTLINLLKKDLYFRNKTNKTPTSHNATTQAHRGDEEGKFNKRRKRIRVAGSTTRTSHTSQKLRGHPQKRKYSGPTDGDQQNLSAGKNKIFSLI
jgi:hypothetical protein